MPSARSRRRRRHWRLRRQPRLIPGQHPPGFSRPRCLAKPRARWMLRVQSRPAAAPALDQPRPAGPPPATPTPPALEQYASPAAAAAEPVAADPSNPDASVPEARVPEARAPEAEAPAAEEPGAPTSELAAAATLASPEPAPARLGPAPAAPAPAPAAPAPAPAAPAPAVPGPAPATPAPKSVTPVPAPADPAPAPAERMPVSQAPGPAPAVPSAPPLAAPAPVAAKFVSAERERPLPSIERALSGPGSRGEVSWRRQVKVVAGGQGPGKRDPETLDRDRARLPLAGPRRIAVLGCTRGAGQTVTALMTGHILAAVRGAAVAALDMNPGATSLAARRAPAVSVQALLAGQRAELAGRPRPGSRPRRDRRPAGNGRRPRPRRK